MSGARRDSARTRNASIPSAKLGNDHPSTRERAGLGRTRSAAEHDHGQRALRADEQLDEVRPGGRWAAGRETRRRRPAPRRRARRRARRSARTPSRPGRPSAWPAAADRGVLEALGQVARGSGRGRPGAPRPRAGAGPASRTATPDSSSRATRRSRRPRSRATTALCGPAQGVDAADHGGPAAQGHDGDALGRGGPQDGPDLAASAAAGHGVRAPGPGRPSAGARGRGRSARRRSAGARRRRRAARPRRRGRARAGSGQRHDFGAGGAGSGGSPSSARNTSSAPRGSGPRVVRGAPAPPGHVAPGGALGRAPTSTTGALQPVQGLVELRCAPRREEERPDPRPALELLAHRQRDLGPGGGRGELDLGAGRVRAARSNGVPSVSCSQATRRSSSRSARRKSARTARPLAVCSTSVKVALAGALDPRHARPPAREVVGVGDHAPHVSGAAGQRAGAADRRHRRLHRRIR